MNTRIITILILTLLFCSFISAEPEFYYKQGEDVDIKIPCVNNGLVCTIAASCNITINYPNGTNMVKNTLMTNSGVYHNYSLTESLTSGEYNSIIYCIDGNNSGANMFTFVINGIGESEDNTYLLMVVIFGLLILSLILTWYFYIIKEPFVYMFFNFSLLFATLLSYFAHTISISYGATFSGVFYAVYLLSLIVFVMIFLFTLLMLTKQALLYLSGKQDDYGDEL